MRRSKVKAEFGELYDRVSSILFENDPVGTTSPISDEYEPEVDTILPRLRTCSSSLDVRRVIHEEFVAWFGAHTAGSLDRYSEIAELIWQEWLKSTPPK